MIHLPLVFLFAVLGFFFFNHRRYWLAFAGAVTLQVLGLAVAFWIGAPRAGGGGDFDLAVKVAVGFAAASLVVLVIGAVQARRATRAG